MRRFNEFNLHRQILAVVGTLPIFGWVGTTLLSSTIAFDANLRGGGPLEEVVASIFFVKANGPFG